jgi:hypothetical protein
LGLAGSVMFTSILGMNNLQALALPQEQVIKTLQEVPVFTLTNPKGEFVVISRKDQSKTISQIGFFISKKDAQFFLEDRIKKENRQHKGLEEYKQMMYEQSMAESDGFVYTKPTSIDDEDFDNGY